MSAKSLAKLGFAALLTTTAFAGSAFAGECPADQTKVDAYTTGPDKVTAATDTVLGQIDLADESIAANGRQFRMRRLEIQPGGEIAWHSHGDRPALIYVVEGEVIEFNSNCAQPIVHKAGEISIETHETSHWWKNNSNGVVVLISADILHDTSDLSM